jgi:P pilus assembly chaperone PapD
MPVFPRIQFILFVCLICTSPAWGKANLGIWPVKVTLHPEHKMGEVHLSNKGEDTVNVQVYAKTWDIDEKGEFVETDTGSFVFYPRLLTIAAGEEKSIRIGYKGDFPPLEKAYRLYIHELPEIRKPGQETENVQVGIQSLLRLSLPLFVSPSKTSPDPRPVVEKIETADTGLRLGVKNGGTHHFTVQRVEAKLLGKDAAVLSTGEAKPHILRIIPLRTVFIDIPMDTDDCSSAENIDLNLFLEQRKKPLSMVLPLQQDCLLDRHAVAE